LTGIQIYLHAHPIEDVVRRRIGHRDPVKPD
jgi:hypothetical protein